MLRTVFLCLVLGVASVGLGQPTSPGQESLQPQRSVDYTRRALPRGVPGAVPTREAIPYSGYARAPVAFTLRSSGADSWTDLPPEVVNRLSNLRKAILHLRAAGEDDAAKKIEEKTEKLEKREHLLQAAIHLSAAGFDDEAQELREFIEKSELAGNPALPQSSVQVTPVQPAKPARGVTPMVFEILGFEAPPETLRGLGFDLSKLSSADASMVDRRPARRTPFSVLPKDHAVLKSLILPKDHAVVNRLKGIKNDKRVHVLFSPKLMAIDGTPARMQIGGLTPVPNSEGKVPGYAFCGTEINLLPRLLSNGKIRLNVQIKHSQPDPGRPPSKGTPSGTTLPPIRTRKIDTTVEIAPDQILILGGLVEKRSPETTVAAKSTSGGSPTKQADEVATVFVVIPSVAVNRPK